MGLALTAAAFSAHPARATEPGLAEAEKLYQSGEWDKARQAFERVYATADVETLPPAFFYNLGTATFRAGTPGTAYVYLMRALAGMPLDADVGYNLRLVRNAVPPTALAVEPVSWISWWPLPGHFIPAAAFALPFLLALGGLLWALGSAQPKKVPLWIALSVLLCALGLLGFNQSSVDIAGVMKNTKVKSGPGPSFPEITTLEAGGVVGVEEARDGWNKIRFSTATGDAVGWLESGALLPLR